MNQSLHLPTEQLIQLLQLGPVQPTTFVGQSLPLFGRRVFGGQILAQAMMAAAKTCNRPVHSLHGYFIRPGDSNFPIEYQVERLRDGQKFSLRQVQAYQHQQLIFSAMISMSIEYADFDTQHSAPAVQMQPTSCKSHSIPNFHLNIQLLESRDPEYQQEYAKTYSPLTGKYDLPIYHQAIAAYYSDYSLLNSALNRLGLAEHDPALMTASLDHSMYFHREFRVDEWMLYQLHCPTAQFGRGLNQAELWQNNRLVCSTMQESVIRFHPQA